MRLRRLSLPLIAAFAVSMTLNSRAHAQAFTTLGSFNGANGSSPEYGPLVQATNGNYYGTVVGGGQNLSGVVFQVTPAGRLTDLYSFCSQPDCADGANPVSSLVLGRDGDFYGTTTTHGAYSFGTIFKMTVEGRLVTLYSFCPAGGPCADGQDPSGLMQASNGNFYGTSYFGGTNNGGTIFEITPGGRFKTLYSFCSKTDCTDGMNPASAPVQARNGNLYGTVHGGGSHGSGALYEITQAGKFRTLYSFCDQTNCTDGSSPWAGLLQASDGNFYGTAANGGANGQGTVFKFTTNNQLVTLHTFDYSDGGYPTAGVIQANDGNFYGTTNNGGTGTGGGGTIYEVTPAGVFSSLYSFCFGSTCNGVYPSYLLAQATNGELTGATNYLGTGGYGTVFSFSTGLSPLVEAVPIAAKPGARVIILGNHLTGSTRVTFNGIPATFTVESDTYIKATVPPGAITGTLSVTTPDGALGGNPIFQVLK